MGRPSASQSHVAVVTDPKPIEADLASIQDKAGVGPSARGVARVHPITGGSVLGLVAGVATMAEKYGKRIGVGFDHVGARRALAFFSVAVTVASAARMVATRFEDEATRRLAPHLKASRSIRQALAGIVKTDDGRDMLDEYVKHCVTNVGRKPRRSRANAAPVPPTPVKPTTA